MYNPISPDLKTSEHMWQLHRHSAALPDETYFCLVMNKVRLPDDIQLKMRFPYQHQEPKNRSW
jgi:hypothetical protein